MAIRHAHPSSRSPRWRALVRARQDALFEERRRNTYFKIESRTRDDDP